MEYHVGKFITTEAVDPMYKEPALVIGVEQKITIITPDKQIRTFNTKDFDDEFLNEDGTTKDLGDQRITDVYLSENKGK